MRNRWLIYPGPGSMGIPVPLIEPGRRTGAGWIRSIPTAPASRTPEQARDAEDEEKEERDEEKSGEEKWTMIVVSDDNRIAGAGSCSSRYDLDNFRATARIVPTIVPEICRGPGQRNENRERNRKWKKSSHL